MIDFSRTGQEIALALINRDNGIYLLPDQVIFGVPVPILGKRNTAVVLNPSITSILYGTKTVYYNRFNLGTFLASKDTTFNRNTSKKLSDLLPAINQRFGINILPDNIIDVTINTQANSTVSLTLKSTDLVFTGSINLSIVNNLSELKAEFTDNELVLRSSDDMVSRAIELRVSGGLPPYTYAWSRLE